jgi:hypothetical protein
MVNGLWFILGIIEVYLQIWYRYLTSGIKALSLAKEGKICFLFLQNCFLGKKKRAAHFRFRYKVFQAEFEKKNWVFEFLSEKYKFQKKKNQLKRSSGSKVMGILNSAVFQGFFGKSRDFLP